MSSATTTPVATTPDPTGVSGSWTPDPDVTSHPLWQRVKDAVELPVDQYDQKYAADDAKIQDKINGVLGHLVPFYKEVSATQPAIEKTKLGKQTGEFVKEQLAHPEQIALGGEFGGENVPTAAIEGATKIGEHVAETAKTTAKGIVEEGKAAIAAKAPAGSLEAGRIGGAGTAPALEKPAPTDFSSVGGVKVERRAPDSPFRTPGTTMKKVADQSYAAMREHGIDTTPSPVETKLEEPSGKFASVGGVEQRAATTFGRTGGSFGRTVDQTYDVLRAQEKPAVEVSNQVESSKNPPLTFEHKPSAHVGDITARDDKGKEVGHISYTLDQTEYPEAHISSALLEPEVQGKGYGQAMYLEAAKQAKARGATSLTSDTLDPTSEDAAHVWDALRRQGYPVEKLGGVNNYRMDLSNASGISNQVESNVTASAIHPDLQKLSDKYGVSDDPEKVRNGASFIRPDGRFVHLPTGMEHDRALQNTFPEKLTDRGYGGPLRMDVIKEGAIRSRFHRGRGGDTLSFSVPEKGVTEEQISALKDAFRTSMDGGRGNLVMEIGTPHGKSTQADYVTANEIEPALARIGAMPNQRVNLSDAYGDTGTYIGGHVPLQAGKDFPGNFEKDNFTSRRTTGNNMFDPEGFITGEEMAKGMTPANSHREFPSEEDYQNTVHSRGVNVEDVVKKYPRVFNDPEVSANTESYADQVRARSRAANWDAQAKGAPEGVTNRQVWNENIGVTHGPDLLEVPKNRIGPNQTTPTVLHHEIGHIIAAHQEGLPTDESFIGSHLSTHSQDTGGAAYTNFDFSRLPGAKKVGGGVTFSPDDLAKAFPTLIHIMLGGGAMEDILDGVPWQKNEGLAGDLRQIRGIGKALGLSPDEVEAKISKQMDATKSRLNTPEILDIVKNASATREEGLSKTLHMSKERVQRDIIQKLNEVTSGKRTDDTSTSAGDTAGTVRGADQGIGKAASSREGQVSGGAARGDESTAVQGSLFSKKGRVDQGDLSPDDVRELRNYWEPRGGQVTTETGVGGAAGRKGFLHTYLTLPEKTEVKNTVESSKAVAAKEDDPYNKIVDLHNENGGSTWNLAQNKNLSGTDNYAVSTHPDRTLPVKGELTPEIVKSFAEKNADLLKDPTESLGTWNDKANNQHVLDVVKTIPDRAEAVRLGFENKQDAIFHLKGEGKEIFMKDERSPEEVAAREALKKDPAVFWHGSPSGNLVGAANGLHVGTHEAAKQALEARIGAPAEGEWDGTREYGKTLLAGRTTLNARGIDLSGHNAQAPVEDYYPSDRGEKAKYSDGSLVSEAARPEILPVKIKGSMTNSPNSPMDDGVANNTMRQQLKKNTAKSGYYYKNIGEDAGSISAVVPSTGHVERVSLLPQSYQDQVDAIRKTHGDDAAFNEVAQYLKPEEREKVGNVLKRNVLDQFAKLPPMEDFEEAAKAGEIQKGWYKNTATVLKDVFGQDTGMFTNIVAALSPLKAVRENFRDALEFYADWVEAGRPTEGRKLDNITTKKFMGTYAQNLQRAVKGEDVSGPKVGNFAENLKGNLDEITKDRWMAFFSGDAKAQWTKSKRQAFDVAMRHTAEKLGWDPAEVQETIWSFVKSVVESSEKEGVTPSEKAKSLTDTEVREGAGSFANLIKDPKIAASFERVAKVTGDDRFSPESVQSSKGYRKAQRATPAPKGQPVRGSAEVLGRVADRTNKAARIDTLQKGIAMLGEEREPGDEDE